ncbi:MAG: FGGY-family carbohydrate kinase [Spirochaetales bacterium]|nr:FGGY-family carbohydrate kinase [Spirochaetales bacterium]
MDTKTIIETGQASLGIEFGSTRIKAVLIDSAFQPVASGGHGWENSQSPEGIWTYPLEEVWQGLQSAFSSLQEDVNKKYGCRLKKLKSLGISGMMHGYLPFDAEGKQLAEFRTWRNNITGEAASELTELFQFNIPQRWSIAHLYQAILKGEEHVKDIAFLTTLAGYIHWKLTGKKVMGAGEASGMFPIDSETGSFDSRMTGLFNSHIAGKSYSWTLDSILPEVLSAGTEAGTLTAEGAALIDPEGSLEAGCLLCPPEGDAGTGMVATNSVARRTGNVSAGTSVFAMLVLENSLKKLHHEIDMVTTPDGSPVAMAHSNNCTSDYDAWIGLLGESAKAMGAKFSTAELYDTLLGKALEGDADCGGLLSYGYISGEHMTGFSEGRPLFARSAESAFTLENFVRSHLYTALCALKTGLNILTGEEGVQVDEIRGHGGFFKTAEVGVRIMAAATETPVSILETAGEGGAWGIALLAAFASEKDTGTLPEFLEQIFAGSSGAATAPLKEDVEGFRAFFDRYHKGLPIERAAVENL